jgi:hypothetical protein
MPADRPPYLYYFGNPGESQCVVISPISPGTSFLPVVIARSRQLVEGAAGTRRVSAPFTRARFRQSEPNKHKRLSYNRSG